MGDNSSCNTPHLAWNGILYSKKIWTLSESYGWLDFHCGWSFILHRNV